VFKTKLALSTFNRVPEHNKVTGDETADELAKQAAASELMGPEPVFGISSNTQFCLGLLRNIVISGSLQRAADKQRCSSDPHAL